MSNGDLFHQKAAQGDTFLFSPLKKRQIFEFHTWNQQVLFDKRDKQLITLLIGYLVTADVSGVTVILTEHYLGLMRTTEEAQTLLYLESDATNATAGWGSRDNKRITSHLSDVHQSKQPPHTHTFKQICKLNASASSRRTDSWRCWHLMPSIEAWTGDMSWDSHRRLGQKQQYVK